MSRRLVWTMALAIFVLDIIILSSNIQLVKAGETIYIGADGSIEGTDKIQRFEDRYYILIDDINGSIVVERDSIIIDGAGYTLQGTRTANSKGLDLSYRNNVTIRNIKIQGFYYGIYLRESFNNSIIANSITNNTEGFYLFRSSNNSMTTNNIISNDNGIWLSGSDNTISGNNIANNTSNGIWSEGSNSTSNSITKNNIANNTYGIVFFEYSDYNGITANNITNNEYGVYLYLSSNNRFYSNNFTENGRHVYDLSWDVPELTSSNNIWDDGYPSGGNYWSDYTGVDADGDGIGDTPYVIDESNQDNYPLMGQAKPSELPMDPTIFYTLIIAITVIVAALAFFLLRRKKKPPEEVVPPSLRNYAESFQT